MGYMDFRISPRSVTMVYPTEDIRAERQFLHWADSSPVQILLSYRAYFSRTATGDRLGMTTLAPAKIPCSRPVG